MTFFAGLATIIGGFITFFVNKNNMKVLSLGLGFSAGVMIFVSLTEIMHSAQELLAGYFPNNYKWMVFFGFIIGVIILALKGKNIHK
jgi:ZIP family zinc transporter